MAAVQHVPQVQPHSKMNEVPHLILTDVIQWRYNYLVSRGVLLHRLCSILLFPSPRFSFTSANNVGVISFQGGCLSSHQAQEQRGGDGSSHRTRGRYRAEPISGLHSWSSSFTAPPLKDNGLYETH